MDFFRSFLGDMFTIAGYCAVFVALHKLFQLTTTLTEIKELLAGQRRIELPAAAVRPVATAATRVPSDSAAHDAGDDEATAYAQNLLRAVNAEQRGEAEPKAV